MKLCNKPILFKILVASSILLFSGFSCKKAGNDIRDELEDVELSYWQVWQNSFDMKPFIEKYNALYPHVKIQFRNLRFEEYEEEMLKALAEDRGPDIFSIPHHWIGLYKNSIAPQPDSVVVKRPVIKPPSGTQLAPTIEKVVTEQAQLLTPREVKRDYYPFVREDVLYKAEVVSAVTQDQTQPSNRASERIMALPLNVDALVLYYNKDILEENNIYEPPETWEKFQEYVIALTKLSDNDTIVQAGAALGAVHNLIRPTDILTALMLQTGVRMVDEENGYAVFHQSIREQDKYNAGLEALRFYTDFADEAKKVYTWNEDQPSALELFKQGKLAFLFGYSYNLGEIRASKVTYGVAPLPTPVIREGIGAITTAHYWVETVAKKSKNQAYAWHFINFLSQPEHLLQLQESTHKLSPRMAHTSQITDPDLAVFAQQAIAAQVWYHGNDAPTAEEALQQMIVSATRHERSLEEALSFGAQQVTQTLR